MFKLYQRETCPYCREVRERLTELQVSYININVPKVREQRSDLIAATGNHFIPALVDSDNTVVPGRLEFNTHILDYIGLKYRDK